ncbi:hypothetical protein N0V83_003327 [Neocucurbitaria cava]|uniref:DUF6536 domain-containing protein n=1 Tax=Neocucurbitaria cava TaxID=798079 RepID=A0A9W9CP70_9PLEO|nr:hypothetical protein N0V83_003327 [Neocucurbitaria cava]
MVKKIFNAPLRLLPSFGKRQSVYQQWTHADTTELQILAAAPSTQSDNSITNPLNQPHSPSPAAKRISLLKTPKAKVSRYLGPRFAGWRFGVLSFAIWASIVFLINFITTIWGSTATSTENGVFFEGDCTRVKSLNSGLHVFINILIKAALMFLVAFGIQTEPLVTMGDAVASFLNKNDPVTVNMCIASLKDFKKTKGYTAGIPRQWNDERYPWKDVTSKTRRTVTILMFLGALIIVSAMLIWGLRSLPSGTPLSGLTFGTIDPRTAIIGMPNSLIPNVLLANTPQIILSLLYFSYNALFTAMLLGYEWTTYASKRKGLRVSHQPTGEQRSTYFLQLPYRFGIPLMVLSGALHWLVSQSIFLEAIDFYDIDGQKGTFTETDDAEDNFTTLGFSPSAIIAVIVLGTLMVISIIGVGFIPYKRGMPLAGTCSMAISAACHDLDNEDTDVAVRRLQWGVVSMGHDSLGHCAFSSKSVEAPVKGEMYAGASYN